MKRNAAAVLVLFLILILVLAWAPWIDNQALHDRILSEKAGTDGTIDKQTGELLCDYNVMWAPFGRWVASCEGGYYVTLLDQPEGNQNVINCANGDWSCVCARIVGEVGCKSYPDCTWTNFHSNDFYCMEQFCMDYDESECALHSRCMWLFDKNGGNEYCEGAAYFDPDRHAIVNDTS